MWLLTLGFFLQSCLPEKDSSFSTEESQKLSNLELSIDAQGNVSHQDDLIGNLRDTEEVTDFIQSYFDGIPRTQIVHMDIDPSAKYSIVSNALRSCWNAKLDTVVLGSSGDIISLGTAPPEGPPEFPPRLLYVEIKSDGQLNVDGIPMGNIQDQGLERFKTHLLRQGQHFMQDPNSKEIVLLDPHPLAKHKFTIDVLNALSFVNKNLDSIQSTLPREKRKLLNRI